MEEKMDNFKAKLIVKSLQEIVDKKFNGNMDLMYVDMLKFAIQNEDYEKAAQIRDYLDSVNYKYTL
jgi:protein-arginine kinase activator protein McsA